jgi:hypothetical protein
MAQESARQRRTTGRVLHEFAHGELKSGPGGKAGKVRSRKQAIAIALKEAGASKTESRRGDGPTRQELYAKAQSQRIPGRSRMSKDELKRALGG